MSKNNSQCLQATRIRFADTLWLFLCREVSAGIGKTGTVLTFVTSLLFPAQCCHCQIFGAYLCQNCHNQIEFLTSQEQSYLVPPKGINSLQSAAHLSGPIHSLVHAVKYGGYRHAAVDLAQLMYTSLSFPDFDIIVPVPIHWYKHWQRGYNQAEEIAKHLGELLNKPVLPLLIRTKYSTAQAGIKHRDQRLQRLQNTFAINPFFRHKTFEKLKILLVDDVLTTGSTLTACAEAFQENHPQEIHAVTIAHGR